MPPYRKIGGNIVLLFSVCHSICLSICTNLTFSHYPKLIYLQGVYLVWGHISSIYICWNQSQGHLQRSRSNIKVTFLKKWLFWGHSCFTNTSCSTMFAKAFCHRVFKTWDCVVKGQCIWEMYWLMSACTFCSTWYGSKLFDVFKFYAYPRINVHHDFLGCVMK